MRVITGSAKGYRLKAPRRMKLRPTPARVKEALFSSLAERIHGASVLDLFAGTGAFAIETLSRGASTATLVEKDPHVIALIGQNLRKTHLEKHARLLKTDVRKALEWLQREQACFDLIFADPPYLKNGFSTVTGIQGKRSTTGWNKGLREESFSWLMFLLQSENLSSLLTPDGILLIEHYKKEPVHDSPYFTLTRQFRFGDTMVGVFRKASFPG